MSEGAQKIRALGMVCKAWVLVLAIGLSSLQAQTQPANPPENKAAPNTPPQLPSLEVLQSRLEQLQQELDAEKQSLAEQQQRHATELERLKKQRAELADRLLDGQIARNGNFVKLKNLTDQAATEATKADKLKSEARAISSASQEAGERLRLYLNEVPGAQPAIDRLRQAALPLARAHTNPQEGKPALATLLQEIAAAHRAASDISVQSMEIYTAGGEREKVKLLALGSVRYAYQTAAGDRIGLALASPRDANGYRWAEELPAELQHHIRDMILAVEAGTPGLATMPLDPSGRIQPENLNQQQSFRETLEAGGPVMIPLGLAALVALGLILERMYVYYGCNPPSHPLIRDVLAACRAQRYDQALALCQQAKGAVARVLLACLSRRPQGQRAMEDGIQEQLLHEMPQLQRFMGGIAILAAVAPLLGLLGTVTGIVHTFGVIKAFGNANPSLMAGGISEALITTAAGLVIAVPILIIHSFLRARSDRILAAAESQAASLLTILVHGPVTVGPQAGKPSYNQAIAQETDKAEERNEEAVVD